ncbi:MAG: chitobiase/beta-hexosaminidase C-terminal domain-containing protein [Phycisphaerae bacterium]|nr:chitobiase/beta-hexosaminidase C-terminal domain-containing protein [Phycisphaerae bacterium]
MKYITIIMLLLTCCAMTACAKYAPVQGHIMTEWANDVTVENVHQEYPRPMLQRDNWLNLNGLWDYAIIKKTEGQPTKFDGQILVPFPVESALSGVKKFVGKDNRLWYKRTFNIPANWNNQHVILNFGAVDFKTDIWVNSKLVGTHKGGFDPFSFDITDKLNPDGSQEIIIAVWDPTSDSYQPRGKQVVNPQGIYYTSVTGIWQTVWLEPVKASHIKSIKATPDIDSGSLNLIADSNANLTIKAKVLDGAKVVKTATGKTNHPISIKLNDFKLWSPDSPNLYDLEVTLIDADGNIADKVQSYFGMRKIALGKDKQGILRLFLNNKPLFQYGPLDQGWWPDGLYTAPSDEALRYDVQMTKDMGFNMLRKHVKVEPQRLYYWCDKIGLLVWQDMPSGERGIGSRDPDIIRSKESAQQYETELKAMIDNFHNHPSIVIWVPFNEGWGQFDTVRITNWIKEYDPSRLVINTSGWADRKCGDIIDMHNYPGPAMPDLEEKRAVVLGEFGGLGWPVKDHLWQSDRNWGYRTYSGKEKLKTEYAQLINNLHPLIKKGLAAAVYTQTTDVEGEVNGLMTYDRKVIKMEPLFMKNLIDGYLPPVFGQDDSIFLKTFTVTINNSAEKGKIRYTTDGSEPTASSTVYTGAFTIDRTVTVKAKTFWANGRISSVSSRTYKKVKLAPASNVSNLKPGLKYSYFTGSFDTLAKLAAAKPVSEGITEKIDISPRKSDSNYGISFQGYVKVPADGIYTFTTDSDDGTDLSINSVKIVVNDGIHGMEQVAGQAPLKAGLHSIEVNYFQGTGGQGLAVYIQGPDMPKQQIPASMLTH